jgi:hypothetical protein
VEVYNHTEEPYIGKIVKLWEEKSTGEKKVLIQWFFRNKELKENPDGNPKEVFLAFGKGKGVTNVNELVKSAIICFLNISFEYILCFLIHALSN